MRRPLIALALLLLAPLVSAQAYKWTDAHGTVHYSETPPPAGTKYSQVTLSGAEVSATQPAAADASAKSSNNAQPATASTVADTPDNHAKFCATVKTNLDMLNGSGPVVMQLDGQQKLIDADQRKQQADAAQAQYQQYCAQQAG
ncbi:MAG: DUF4124 domain-containing protein [Rhodanobacter sp.]